MTRREFLAASATTAISDAQTAQPSVDFRKLVSRADLIYEQPVTRSEEGIPVGNGRMGSLLWTTPTELRFQINRVDVYANNCESNSFFERHNDYCGGCGFVEIYFGDTAEPPFPESGFTQRLSVYDALLHVEGKGVNARILAWPERDVIAIDVDDARQTPHPVEVSLRMLRYETKYFGADLEKFAREHVSVTQTRSHTATSQLLTRDACIVLTQEFREGGYVCKSAVAIGASRESTARFPNETELRLRVGAGSGAFTILIASAATFDANEDIAESALRQLREASSRGFAALARDTQEWWHRFWARGFVELSSADGVAEFVEQNYTYYLYIMAATSRGRFPPKFNGMLWNTDGDLRTWGAQHWFANLSCYYEALPAANRIELMDPAFDMYSGIYNSCAEAARQQWGSQGMYIPETVYFDGLARLPDSIAAEMRELYLGRKPWEKCSPEFRAYAQTKHPHSSRWNWIQNGSWVDGRWVTTERGFGPYGATNHILGTTAKIAYLYWRRYEFTLDREWLRTRAWPMLRGAAEFYRKFPNVKKGGDGRYHIHGVNSNESVYGARDTDEDLSAMHALFAVVLKASDILKVDEDLRPVWREFLDHLAALPTTGDPDALRPAAYTGPLVFVRGRTPAVKPGGLLPDGNSLPMWFFDLCHVGTSNKERLRIAHQTFDASLRGGLSERTPVSVLSKTAIAAASLGRADAVRYLVPNQIRALSPERSTAYKNGGVLANRMTLREGPQALDAQRLGRAAEALHLALLQSYAPEPGGAPVLHVFPAWPKEWKARFRLLARGGFLVDSEMEHGRIGYVALESQAGAPCMLRNPWNGGEVVLQRERRPPENFHGEILVFQTQKGEKFTLRSA